MHAVRSTPPSPPFVRPLLRWHPRLLSAENVPNADVVALLDLGVKHIWVDIFDSMIWYTKDSSDSSITGGPGK